MAKARKKTFGDNVGQAVESGTSDVADLKALFQQIPMSGDDLINELLETTSERTVDPPKSSAAVPAEAPMQIQEGHLGEETDTAPEFVQEVQEVARRTGKSLSEAEQIVQRSTPQIPTPPPGAVTGEYYGKPYSNSGMPSPPAPQLAAPSAPREPLTPQELQGNAIAAEELITWYDTLQSVGSVWAYDYFTQPKNAVKLVDQLSAKVIAGTATAGEKEAFAAAQKTVTDYAVRKGKFHDGASMSDDLKARSIRLLDKILEVRQITIPPEALLALLLLTPLVMNTGTILKERFGFKEADDLLAKFTTFVNKSETKYHDENP